MTRHQPAPTPPDEVAAWIDSYRARIDDGRQVLELERTARLERPPAPVEQLSPAMRQWVDDFKGRIGRGRL